MSSRIYRTIAFLVVISYLIGMSGSAQAAPIAKAEKPVFQDPVSTDCSNLDVIFIVDQSDSMSGALASDPLEGRRYAIEAMIDLLTDLAVDQCANNTYRVAVISFGNSGSTRVDLPLSNINPENVEEGRALRNRLVQSLKADQLGQTYPIDGFREAYKIFRDASQYGSEPRKRVLLLLSDGIPCSEGVEACNEDRDFVSPTTDVAAYINSAFPFNSDLLAGEHCMAELRAQHEDEDLPENDVNACLAMMPEDKQKAYGQSTYFYTILLKSDLSYPAHVLEIFQSVSESHAGRLIELRRNLSEIPSTMRQVLSELVGIRPNLLECGNPFAVDPYLNKLRVTVYNISSENKIVLTYTDANGQSHQIQNGIGDTGFTLAEPYYVFGVNERYVFSLPYPGQWQVTAEDCTGVDIFAEPIQFSMENYQPNLPDELAEYDIQPYYSVDEPHILEYQMKSGNLIVEQAPQSLFAIHAEAVAVDPTGKEVHYPMVYRSTDKKFLAATPLQLPVSGTYKLTLRGETVRTPGEIVVPPNMSDAQIFSETYELFHFENEFKVFPVDPFVLQAVSPHDGQVTYNVHGTLLDGWPLKVLPQTIRLRIVDRSNTILPGANDFFTDPDKAFTATLSAGGATSETVALLPDPRTPGEFVGEIRNFDVNGTQNLKITVSMDVVKEKYRPDFQSLDLSFSRADSLFHRASTYIVSFWLAILLIIGMIVYNIMIRRNKISGSLIFVDGATTIAEFGLYSGTNTRRFKKRELGGYPQLMLKGMRAKNVGRKRRTTTNQDAGIADEYYEGQPGLHLDCVSSSGRKFSVELPPKIPTAYSSEETIAQMVYEPVE